MKPLKFAEDRARLLRFIVEQDVDDAGFAAIDFSESTAKVRFRAWKPPADSLTASDYVLDVDMTKVGDGSAGKFNTFVTFLAGYEEIECAYVFVDEAVTAQPTPTTFREVQLVTWKDSVAESVQP